jgi:HK97 family phage portal protein
LVLWRDDDQDSEQVAEEDEFVRLFRKPNALMSASKFWTAHLLHRHLDGEDFWMLTDAEGMPAEAPQIPASIWPIRGSQVQVHSRMANGVPSEWKYNGSDGKPRIWPATATVQFSEYDPDNMVRGLGSVKVLSRQMDLMLQAERYSSGALRNGGDPGGFIKYKTSVGTQVEKERLEQSLDDLFHNPENKGRHIILDSDADYQANKLSPKDMEYSVLWKLMRDTILGVLGVPPPLVGVMENSTYNNLREAKYDLWTGGLGVLTFLTNVEKDMKADIWSRYPAPVDRYCGLFDTKDVEALKHLNNEKLKEARELVRAGAALSWNEAFEMVGLDTTPPRNGDTTWLRNDLVPVGDVEGGDPEEPVSAFELAAEPEAEAGQAVEPAAVGADAEPDGDTSGDTASGFDGAQMQVAAELVRDVQRKSLSRETGARTLALLLGIEESAAMHALGDAGQGGTDILRLALSREPDAPVSERAMWLNGIEERVFRPNDAKLFGAARRFLRNKRAAQIRRIEAVAAGRKSVKALLDSEAKKKPTIDEVVKALMLDPDEWINKLKALIGPQVTAAWRLALDDAASDIGGDTFAPTDPEVIKLVQTQVLQLSEGVNSTLSKKVRAALVKALKDEDLTNITSIQNAVKQALPELKGAARQAFGSIEARALAIARTESARAGNTARFVQMQEEGVKKHEWVSARDGEERESHAAGTGVDGQVRTVGKKFSNGLLHPHDPDGPAKEVVNCRCATRAAK